jgi:hypothetical protein
MIRRIVIAGIIAAGLLAPLPTAVPASAGVYVGCDGNDCSALLTSLITLTGDRGPGSGYTPVNYPPPPCLWEPIGDATSGSNYIISFFGGTEPDPGSAFGTHDSFVQAKELLKDPQPGTWYELPVNPAASPADQQKCLQLPLFYFLPPGGDLPGPPIPAETIAGYAYNHMRIPSPRIVTNPAGKAYVNLGTYVWARWPRSHYTRQRVAYEVVAQLGSQIVSVWAQAEPSLQVNVTGPGTPSTSCGPTGSTVRPIGHAPAGAGAGVAPDCGVLWRGPDAQASVSATVTWDVSWGTGILNGPTNNTLPSIPMTSRPVPLRVSEIQSINGN